MHRFSLIVAIPAMSYVIGLGVPGARADDRHAGYYYPPLTSDEVYDAPIEPSLDSDRARRIGFIIGVTQEQFSRPYPPPWAMYAKGTDSEKMIIVALDGEALVTLFQARAMLAQLTSVVRSLPLFVEGEVEEDYNFLDLLAALGFRQLTISDGRTYTHQISIE